VRALLVTAELVGVMLGFFAPARAAIVAPQVGQTITQTDLFGYLFVAPQAGDWVRYRVSVNGNPVATKTIGFGTGTLGATQAAFFEIQTQTSGLVSSPVASQSVAGGTITWKMFVDAPDFNDSLRLYSFAGGIIKIGDALFRLGGDPSKPVPATYHQTLQSLLLFGLLPMPDSRAGIVVSSRPENVSIRGVTLNTVHTIVDFPPRDIGGSTGLPESRVETWQTTDVPLGLVTVRVTTNGGLFSVDLTAFGHGTYHGIITQDIDAVPYFPGS